MNEYDLAYRDVSAVKALTLFFFSPRRFGDYAAWHDFGWLLTDGQDLRASFERGTYTIESADVRTNSDHRVKMLRKSFWSTGLIILTTAVIGIALGFVIAKTFGTIPNWASSLVQAIAVAIILWVTLWQLGRGIQSFGGSSLSERVHGWIFNIMYTFGSLLFFVVYGWQA